MRKLSFLEFARQYLNEGYFTSKAVAIRNRAYFEIYNVNMVATYATQWSHIHFGEHSYISKPFRCELDNEAAEAIYAWLETLWELSNHIGMGLNDYLFAWEVQNTVTGDVQILKELELTQASANRIIDLLRRAHKQYLADIQYDRAKRKRWKIAEQVEGEISEFEEQIIEERAKKLRENHITFTIEEYDARRLDNFGTYECFQTDREIFRKICDDGYIRALQVS